MVLNGSKEELLKTKVKRPVPQKKKINKIKIPTGIGQISLNRKIL